MSGILRTSGEAGRGLDKVGGDPVPAACPCGFAARAWDHIREPTRRLNVHEVVDYGHIKGIFVFSLNS